ncbi:MAG TPA: hypothetical protein VFY78_13115, partial [Gammaproteobacteria bacterium]|nr:hypothetical protein [Gammaproteobacteria bacterium]
LTPISAPSASLRQIFFLILLFFITSTQALAAEWSGNISTQWRHFFSDPLSPASQQHNDYLSIAAEPEFYHAWDDKQQSLTITPFVRIDQYDNERSHGDIRELMWRNSFDDWQIKAGIGKVFWGVTESQHLVDVINQTDMVENPDGEDKLGQPMIQTTLQYDWGNVELFIMPYFRERTFAGIEGRPLALPVNTRQSVYESPDEQQHIDYAARLFIPVDIWEFGISWFDGTSREPLFNFDPVNNHFIPYYLQMQQLGLAVQATTDEWLWKLETIHRSWSAENFTAATGGFEYTFVGVFDSSADIGWVAEYLYDNRGNQATTFFEHDVMMGLRLALNDEASTDALLGFIIDKNTHDTLISLEASRRLGSSWKLSLEARAFTNIDSTSLVYGLRKDDYIQLDLAYYF